MHALLAVALDFQLLTFWADVSVFSETCQCSRFVHWNKYIEVSFEVGAVIFTVITMFACAIPTAIPQTATTEQVARQCNTSTFATTSFGWAPHFLTRTAWHFFFVSRKRRCIFSCVAKCDWTCRAYHFSESWWYFYGWLYFYGAHHVYLSSRFNILQCKSKYLKL